MYGTVKGIDISMASQTLPKEQKEGEVHFVSRTITLKPGGSKSVGLGVYTERIPHPDFKLRFVPDIKDMIVTSLDRLDIPGKSKYMLLYQFRNNSTKECTVNVEQA